MSTEAIAERRKAKNATAADLTTKKHARAPTDLEVRELTEEENRKSYFDIALMLIEEGLKTEDKGREDWINGTIMLIEALNDERKRLGDQAFGKWLTDNGYGEDRITRHNRSALLNMAIDLDITRDVLEQTHRRSWRHIWEEEIQPRLPHVGQPADPDGEGAEEPQATTRRPKKAKRAKQPGNEPEWLQDTRGWFGNQVDSINVVVREVTAVMEKCKDDEQHKKLRKIVEPWLLLDALRKGVETCEKFDAWLALDDAADAEIEKGRVKTTPTQRTSRSIQASA
jgi:hypothetical protein